MGAYDNIGQMIKSLRLENDYTLEEFSKKLGVPVSVIKSWEYGYRNPSKASQELICDCFNVDLNYLLGLSSVKNSYISNKTINIPLYDCSKLSESFSSDQVIDTLVLSLMLLRDFHDCFAIRASDNSMLCFGIPKNSLLVFRKTRLLNNNDIGLFQVDNCNVVRKFNYSRKETVLYTENSDYTSYKNVNYKILGKLIMQIIQHE